MPIFKVINGKLVEFSASHLMSLDQLGIGKPDGTTISVDNNGILSVAEKLTSKIDNKADKAKWDSYELLSSKWISWNGGTTAPFTYGMDLSSSQSSLVNNDSIIELVLPNEGVSAEQVKAYQNASIATAILSSNKKTITLTAYGEKPTVNLPLIVMIRG